jgi:hypothetical protein
MAAASMIVSMRHLDARRAHLKLIQLIIVEGRES